MSTSPAPCRLSTSIAWQRTTLEKGTLSAGGRERKPASSANQRSESISPAYVQLRELYARDVVASVAWLKRQRYGSKPYCHVRRFFRRDSDGSRGRAKVEAKKVSGTPFCPFLPLSTTASPVLTGMQA